MVYSALALIGVFLSSAFILLMLKADFLGFLFIIVYVGAVSILFLFVIMNLSIKKDEFRQASSKYNNRNYQDKLLFLFFLSVLFFLAFAVVTDPLLAPMLNKKVNFFNDLQVLGWYANVVQNNSINAISSTLYTYNSIYLIVCGLMLLVAMIGAISLTLEETTFTRKQDAQEQIFKELKTTINLNKLKK